MMRREENSGASAHAEVHNVFERIERLPDDEEAAGRIPGAVPAHIRVSAWVSGQLLLWTIAGAVCYAALVR
jgi:hypothetical protein